MRKRSMMMLSMILFLMFIIPTHSQAENGNEEIEEPISAPNKEVIYSNHVEITSTEEQTNSTIETNEIKPNFSKYLTLPENQQSKLIKYFDWNDWQCNPEINVFSDINDNGSNLENLLISGITKMGVKKGDTVGEMRLFNTSLSLKQTKHSFFSTDENTFVSSEPTKYLLMGKKIGKNIENIQYTNPIIVGNSYEWETHTQVKQSADKEVGAPGINPNFRFGAFKFYSQLISNFCPNATPWSPKITLLSHTNGHYQLSSYYNAITKKDIDSTKNHYLYSILYSILIPQVIKVQYRDVDNGEELSQEQVYGQGKRIDDNVSITAPKIEHYDFANKWETVSLDDHYNELSDSDVGPYHTINPKLSTYKRGIVFYYRKEMPEQVTKDKEKKDYLDKEENVESQSTSITHNKDMLPESNSEEKLERLPLPEKSPIKKNIHQSISGKNEKKQKKQLPKTGSKKNKQYTVIGIFVVWGSVYLILNYRLRKQEKE